jgi:hypothetical protein
LQPTQAERSLDFAIVAARGSSVVARYFLKGVDASGRRIVVDTLAHYEVGDGQLTHARMYHFDLDQLIVFLRGALPELPAR